LIEELPVRFVSAAALLLFLSGGILLGGCGRKTSGDGKGPPTVPVKGKVVFTRGGTVKSLADKQARIELESVDQPGVRAIGPIQEDGSFEVATVTTAGGSPGAVAGKHRVRLDLEENAASLVAPQFLDAAKSGIVITLPSGQPIEVQVWR
jgi:hypothetical protein